MNEIQPSGMISAPIDAANVAQSYAPVQHVTSAFTGKRNLSQCRLIPACASRQDRRRTAERLQIFTPHGVAAGSMQLGNTTP